MKLKLDFVVKAPKVAKDNEIILLKDKSENFTKPVNMSDFFLNETQAQLQLAMFGFSDEFQEKTNKKVRDAFAGINVEYIGEFSEDALNETDLLSPFPSAVLNGYT